MTGPIPAELGDLVSLQELYLSSNQLTGPIPATLGNLANLQVLCLDHNQLTGPIPAELGNLANLRALDLSYNYLTIPQPGSFLDWLDARHGGDPLGWWRATQFAQRILALRLRQGLRGLGGLGIEVDEGAQFLETDAEGRATSEMLNGSVNHFLRFVLPPIGSH